MPGFFTKVFGTKSKPRLGHQAHASVSMPRVRQGFRPSLEALEDRWVPSTIVVNRLGDDITVRGTLRYAVAHAQNGDTIKLTGPVTNSPIVLTHGELVLTHNVTITAEVDAPVTISGNNSSRIFRLGHGVNVSITDVVLTAGQDGNGGGAILSDYGATLSLTRDVLTNNSVGSFGGAISNVDGILSVDSCLFSGNSAVYGGAIFNQGSHANAIILNSVFTQNSATLGGAIQNQFGATMQISACTLSGNTSSGNGYAGAISNILSTLTIDNCILSNNRAFRGGCIDNEGADLTINQSTLSGNTATFAGGAIFNADYGVASDLSLNGCSFSGNAASTGGAILNGDDVSTSITGCTFANNVASLPQPPLPYQNLGCGGAICTYGDLSLSNSNFLNNHAAVSGGAIFNVSPFLVPNNDLSINGCGFSGNSATNGGAISNLGTLEVDSSTFSTNAALENGGAVFNGDNATATITECAFAGNRTAIPFGGDGGGILNQGGTVAILSSAFTGNFANSAGGAIANATFQGTANLTVQSSTFSGNSCRLGDGGAIMNWLDSTATITDCDISGNSTPNAGGGVGNYGNLAIEASTLSGNSALSGGALSNTLNGRSTATLTNCIIANNQVAIDGGGILNKGTLSVSGTTFSGNSSSGPGGGEGGSISNLSGTLEVDDCTFSNNTAGFGGVIYNWPNSTVTITGCTITNNHGPLGGGAIFNQGDMTVQSSLLSGNSTTYEGGGIQNLAGTLEVDDCTVSNNTAEYGGGIWSVNGSATITGCSIVYNHATVDGGGIENAGDLTVESSVLSFNVARNGGAIDNDGGTATITGCTINGNQASGDGGGIYNEAAMTVTGCSFGGNVAQFGGALANSTRGTTTITDSIFVRNFAEFEGGALYTVRGGSLSVGTSEFTNNTPDHIFGDWNDLGGNIFH